jgi:hypothetical protein
MNRDAMARGVAAVLAGIGWFGLALQLWVSIGLSAANGKSASEAVWIYLGYFTVLTNIIVAVLFTARAVAGRWAPGPSAMTAGACYILIVGVVFVTVLQNLYELHGAHLIADRTMHHLMPVLTVAYWVHFVPKGSLKWGDAIVWLAFPIGYVLYAYARGVLDGFYPYPFVDVSKIGWPQTLLNSAGLFVAFLLVGLGAIALDGRMGKAKAVA